MKENAKAMVLASFAADALSLGVHWIYNTNVIDKKWGRVENYIKPERPTYHPTKDLGELTHYGDQTLVLLNSITQNAGFDLKKFAADWQHFFKGYEGYLDTATKKTLENFKTGSEPRTAGSDSDDFAGAARIAPLAYYYRTDLAQLLDSAKAQTALTHNNQKVIDSAAFSGQIAFEVLNGARPVAAIQEASSQGFNHPPFSKWIEAGLQSIEKDTRQAILDFGQMCEIDAAFPCVIHLIAKYEDDLKAALIENVMAGGDSAGRGLAVGMILGAHLGIESIPSEWLSGLKSYRRIMDCLEQIDQKVR